jgi:hypothetical protein
LQQRGEYTQFMLACHPIGTGRIQSQQPQLPSHCTSSSDGPFRSRRSRSQSGAASACEAPPATASAPVAVGVPHRGALPVDVTRRTTQHGSRHGSNGKRRLTLCRAELVDTFLGQ